MPTPLQNLTSIFNNRVFRIPDYQRRYAWGQQQLEDFWEDAGGVKGYFNGSYSEIDVAQRQEWTPSAVLDRGLAMLDFLEKRWRVSLGSRPEKMRLLGLEFLELADA